jgi:HNH endonuclease
MCTGLYEIWRPIPNFPNYEISNLGYVHGSHGELKPWEGNYLYVTLWRDGEKSRRTVHSLVAEAFIGPCPPGKEVNHKDLKRTNNRWSNLEYKTHRGNIHHAIRHGHKGGKSRFGEENPNNKLSESNVRSIRRKFKRGWTKNEISEKYGVTLQMICRIIDGKAWAWLN